MAGSTLALVLMWLLLRHRPTAWRDGTRDLFATGFVFVTAGAAMYGVAAAATRRDGVMAAGGGWRWWLVLGGRATQGFGRGIIAFLNELVFVRLTPAARTHPHPDSFCPLPSLLSCSLTLPGNW